MSVRFRQGAAVTLDPDAAADRGLDALKTGAEAETLPVLEDAVRAHPRHARLWQVIGLLHRALDQLGPAISALKEAERLAPADARIALGVAQASLEAGLPAVALFDRARALAPNNGDLLLSRAAAQMAQDGPAAAIGDIETLIAANPGWLPGHSLLARLRWLIGDRDHFTASYARALATAPRDISLWRELITTLIHADRFDAARDAVTRGRALAGAHLVFDANEAVCLAETGDLDAADTAFAALAGQEDITLAVRHARHLLRSNRPDEAARLAERWTGHAQADLIWPYVTLAWRLTHDARWEWLEGDDRLVRHFDVEGLPDLACLAAVLRALHVTSHQPLEQSVRGGTQTDGPLFMRTEPEIVRLRAAIAAAVEVYIAQLPPVDPRHPFLRHARDQRVRFAGSWSVRLPRQGHHSNHIHPAGWISSAFYVALPDEAERGPAPAGWLQLGTPQSELGIDLPPTRMIEPRPGRLALFPSTMWHGTMPFDAGERLTVAFDVARPR